MVRVVVNMSAVLHKSMVTYWKREEKRVLRQSRRLMTRFERSVAECDNKSENRGDKILQNVREMFNHGLGIRWGLDQQRVFAAFVFSCLPLIYGEEWPENKARVLAEFGKEREEPYSVVSMARRNGKTFVTSGTVAALLLCVPGIKVAIFSTCKRTSGMMMEATTEMIERAFEKGTHCNKTEFIQLSKNMENVTYMGPDGTKRILGCFPGSVRVSTAITH